MKSIENVDWARIECGLDAQGWAVAERLLGPDGCKELAQLYGEDGRFRSTVTMARHGFGRGEYRYFTYPLPELVGDLRAALYPHLAPVANRWNLTLGLGFDFPESHTASLARCPQAGPARTTPLHLRSGVTTYNFPQHALSPHHAFPNPKTPGSGNS